MYCFSLVQVQFNQLFYYISNIYICFDLSIYFNNKNQIITIKKAQIQQLMGEASQNSNELSRKLNDALQREQSLKKINNELTKILKNTQIEQYTQLLSKINQMQITHAQQVNQLRLKIARQESQYAFLLKQKNNHLEDIQQKLCHLQGQVQMLKDQLHKKNVEVQKLAYQMKKYKKMVRNQQSLLDSFKKSVDQQIMLQKQVLKSTYKQKETILKNTFEKTIQEIQQSYEKKIKNISKQNKQNNYKNQLKNLQKYLSLSSSQKGKNRNLNQNFN